MDNLNPQIEFVQLFILIQLSLLEFIMVLILCYYIGTLFMTLDT